MKYSRFYYLFPINTGKDLWPRKIARHFREIWENSWMEIETFGTIFIVVTLS
jgi:hypothetical protein